MVRDDKEESGWRKVADSPAPASKEIATAGDGPEPVLVGGDEVDMDGEDVGEAA